MSNGTPTIYKIEPTNFTVVSKLDTGIKNSYGFAVKLNELEMVDDKFIFANDYQTNLIYKINKSNG